MKRIFAALLAVAVVAPASPILAKPPAPEDKSSLDRVVCTREPVIGSRAQTRRICMTRREQIKLQNGTRDGMDAELRRTTSGAPTGG